MNKFDGLKRGWKVFFACWSLLFLLFAYWQLNDPDPEWWVPVYLVGSIVSGLLATGRFPMLVLVALTLFYLASSLFFFPQDIFGWISQEAEQMDLTMKTPEMEINREFFGLVILAMVTGSGYFVGRSLSLARNKKNDE